ANTLHLIISGLLIFGALFTKVPVGAFPLIVPVLYWLAFHTGNIKLLGKAVGQTIALVLIITGCYLLLYQFPQSRANLDRYLHEQLVAALAGKREITGGGLGRLF